MLSVEHRRLTFNCRCLTTAPYLSFMAESSRDPLRLPLHTPRLLTHMGTFQIGDILYNYLGWQRWRRRQMVSGRGMPISSRPTVRVAHTEPKVLASRCYSLLLNLCSLSFHDRTPPPPTAQLPQINMSYAATPPGQGVGIPPTPVCSKMSCPVYFSFYALSIRYF